MDRLADIARELAKVREPAALERLLRELLTRSEAQKVSLRWEIVRLLTAGKSQRAVAHKLGVSLCNITRGARVLKKQGSAMKRVFNQQSPVSKQSIQRS